MLNKMTGFSTALVLLVLASTQSTVESKVQMVNNGYKGVVIAVSPDVPENPMLLSRMEVSRA